MVCGTDDDRMGHSRWCIQLLGQLHTWLLIRFEDHSIQRVQSSVILQLIPLHRHLLHDKASVGLHDILGCSNVLPGDGLSSPRVRVRIQSQRA